MTSRTRGLSLPQIIEELTPYLVGWRGYFGFCQTPRVLTNLEAWIRRRLRSYLWRQWGNGHNRFEELRRRGVSQFRAAVAVGSPTVFWRMSEHPAVQAALRNETVRKVGGPFAPGYNLPYQENGRDRVQWRVIVELSNTVGAKQVHEVHVGGNATPGCSATPLGLSLAEARSVLAGAAAPSCSGASRRALQGPATLPSMWGTAAAEGSAATAAAAVVRYCRGPRPAV